jgi:hypothetical protein
MSAGYKRIAGLDKQAAGKAINNSAEENKGY